MLNIHDIDADFERLTAVVTGIATLAGVAYTAFQNARQRKESADAHRETIAKVSSQETKNGT